MKKYKLLCDSSADLNLDFYNENDIDYIPFSISFNDIDYDYELRDFTLGEFYLKLASNSNAPKTSLPSVGDYEEIFLKNVQNGLDILCICLSSSLSGSFQSATTAKSIILEQYPDAKINIIDSMQASTSQGYLVKRALTNLNKGLTIEENTADIENFKTKIEVYFVVDSLTHLIKGGRLNVASGFLGSMLDIKPILQFKDGVLKPISKIRKLKKSYGYLAKKAVEANNNSNKTEFILVYSGFESYADDLKDELANVYNLKQVLPISRIGVTIGAHVGPTAFGIVIINK